MRRISSSDKLNALVAGALSALSLLVDAKDRRVFFALVLFSRSLVTLTTITFYLGYIFKHTTEKRLI